MYNIYAAIIQGLYVLRKDEGIEDEERQEAQSESTNDGLRYDGQQRNISEQYRKAPKQQEEAESEFDRGDFEKKLEEATKDSLRW